MVPSFFFTSSTFLNWAEAITSILGTSVPENLKCKAFLYQIKKCIHCYHCETFFSRGRIHLWTHNHSLVTIVQKQYLMPLDKFISISLVRVEGWRVVTVPIMARRRHPWRSVTGATLCLVMEHSEGTCSLSAECPAPSPKLILKRETMTILHQIISRSQSSLFIEP